MRLAEIAATPIADVSLQEPLRVSSTTSLGQVVDTMRQADRAAVLVDDGHGVVGIFSERDLMKRVDHSDASWKKRAVRDVMTKQVETIRADQTISQALTLMTVGGFRHLPVLDADDKVLGVVSVDELLVHVVEYFPADFVNLPPDPAHESSGRWGG